MESCHNAALERAKTIGGFAPNEWSFTASLFGTADVLTSRRVRGHTAPAEVAPTNNGSYLRLTLLLPCHSRPASVYPDADVEPLVEVASDCLKRLSRCGELIDRDN